MDNENSQTDNNTSTGSTPADNNGGFNFSSALSAEYANHPSILKFNGNINDMAKSYLSLEQTMGQGNIAIPKDANDAVAWEAYDKAFGIPTADKYDIKSTDENTQVTPEFKEIMHRNHISNAAAQDIFNEYVKERAGYAAEAAQEAEVQYEATVSALKSEWGAKYQQNMKLASDTLAKFSANKEEYSELLNLVGNSATAIRLLNKIGSSISEGSLGGFEGQTSGFTKTPTEARAEFERIMNDPSDAYWAGARNRRNDLVWCKNNNQGYVSEDARKARVQYVNSLMQMMG